MDSHSRDAWIPGRMHALIGECGECNGSARSQSYLGVTSVLSIDLCDLVNVRGCPVAELPRGYLRVVHCFIRLSACKGRPGARVTSGLPPFYPLFYMIMCM